MSDHTKSARASRHPLLLRFLALAMGMSLAGGAQADITEFVLGMRASGTDTFDPTDGPGRDTSAGDDVVRTHDSFVYRVGYSLTPQDGKRQVTVSMGDVELPGGYSGPLAPSEVAYFSVADLPTGANGCSNISSTPVAWPPAPNNTVSGVSADGQHIVCYQADSASASNMDFIARVGGAAPNGTTIAPPSVSFESANNPRTDTPTVVTGPIGDETFYGAPTLKVSAAPRWLVAKKPAHNGAAFVPGSGPNGENGYVLAFNIGLYAKGSRKGLEALQPNYTIAESFNDTDMPNARLIDWKVSVAGFADLPMGPGTEPAAQNGCGDWHGQLVRLGNYFDNVHYHVSDWGATESTADNANYTVARGGTCKATAVDNTAKTATLELSGTDFSLQRYPTVEGRTGYSGTLVDVNNLEASTNQWWVASKSILIWVPVNDLTPSVTEKLTNTATLSGISVTGQTNPSSTAEAEASVTRSTGGAHSKIYTTPRVWQLPAGERAATRDPNVTSDTVVNQVSAGQIVAARVIVSSQSPTNYGAGYFCEKIDNTRLALADMRAAPLSSSLATWVKDDDTGIMVLYQTGSAAATPITWSLGVDGNGTSGGTWDGRDTVADEYVHPATGGATGHASALCADTDATWYPSIAALEAAGRTLDEVTRVRGSYTSFQAASVVQAHIPLRVRATYAYSGTDTLSGGGTVSFTLGQSTAGAIVPNQSVWWQSNPFPKDPSILKRADALRITETEYARITKTAAMPHNNNGGQVMRGAHVTYQLQVNLSSTSSLQTTNVEVWDVLPQHVSYIPGSSRLGGTAIADPTCWPSGTTPPAPAPFADGSVADGYQACRWALANQPVVLAPLGDPAADLPLLTFQGAVALDAPAGTALLNTSFADSTHNLLGKAQYKGAANGFQCASSGAVCSFSNWTLNVSGTAGIVLDKSVSAPQVPVETGFEYALEYASVGTTLHDLRLLDVLPFNGDGRGSGYTGSLRLSGPIAPPVAEAGPPATAADPDLVVRYTSNAPANINRDPYDASHNLTGTGSNSASSTNWCTVAQFGVGACPADAGAATAFMALPRAGAGGLLPANTAYRLRVPVLASGNVRGDRYFNDYIADSPSLTARRPGSNAPGTLVVTPDLVLSKTASPASIAHGATTVFSLTVRNNSGAGVIPIANVAGTEIVVTDALPAGLQAQLPVTGGTDWDCAASTASQLSCRYTGALPIAVGQQVGGVISVTAIGNVPGTLVNNASVRLDGQPESPPDNNKASATVTVQPNAGQTVSGRVYREASSPANTADDGNAVDPGIAGVTLRLVCTNPAYDQTVTTGADGSYAFTGVTSGAECTITQTQPSGYTNAYNLRGPGATADSDASPTGDSSITLTVPAGGSSGNSFAETLTGAGGGAGVTPVPTLQGWLLGLLAALMGGLAAARRRQAA